jgi:hypothetical protein
MEEAARIAERRGEFFKPFSDDALDQSVFDDVAAAIRAAKEQPTPSRPSPPGENLSG